MLQLKLHTKILNQVKVKAPNLVDCSDVVKLVQAEFLTVIRTEQVLHRTKPCPGLIANLHKEVSCVQCRFSFFALEMALG